MNDRLHLIIAGETGEVRTITFSRKKLYFTFPLMLLVLAFLLVSSFFTTRAAVENQDMKEQIIALKQNNRQFRLENEKLQGCIAAINIDSENRLKEIKARYDLETSSIKTETDSLVAGKVEELKARTEQAISELQSRTRLIESVMSEVGVNIKVEPKKKPENGNKGGVFIPFDEYSQYEELLERTDYYLDTIKSVPIGRPAGGRITSGYGKRVDPFNNLDAFHTGIDLKGKLGEKVLATADGTVTWAFVNGGYGKYLEIDHGNGYKTRFAHLHKILVKKGDQVHRGQVIGQVGNTGRSTGCHLHYEVVVNEKAVNPFKFIKISDKSYTLKANLEK
ncbi:MAG: hypothetical protein CSB24_05405 [Deltaproteobacteria bacterium]|nr:MAG: hypothetical protein CSB24_05405 [Deltaproteobacteria bacterium]